MEEQIISLKTALLAKDKGFKEKSLYYVWDTEKQGYTELSTTHSDRSVVDNPLAPTQSLLQKWLREKYKLVVEPMPVWETNTPTRYNSEKWNFSVNIMDAESQKQMQKYYVWGEGFKTCEDALEAGLIAALNLIKP